MWAFAAPSDAGAVETQDQGVWDDVCGMGDDMLMENGITAAEAVDMLSQDPTPLAHDLSDAELLLPPMSSPTPTGRLDGEGARLSPSDVSGLVDTDNIDLEEFGLSRRGARPSAGETSCLSCMSHLPAGFANKRWQHNVQHPRAAAELLSSRPNPITGIMERWTVQLKPCKGAQLRLTDKGGPWFLQKIDHNGQKVRHPLSSLLFPPTFTLAVCVSGYRCSRAHRRWQGCAARAEMRRAHLPQPSCIPTASSKPTSPQCRLTTGPSTRRSALPLDGGEPLARQ